MCSPPLIDCNAVRDQGPYAQKSSTRTKVSPGLGGI